jgi:diguanylate cyclase (GGDEF)-like protein
VTEISAVAGVAGLAILAFLLGERATTARLQRQIQVLRREAAHGHQRLDELRHLNQDLVARSRSSETTVEKLRRSIVEIPEIAQRLFSTRTLSEIPERALDLVHEVFEPSYSVFYRASRGDLVAVSCRGACEYGVGHRIEHDQGIVGWTALKQLTFTPEDAALESGSVKARNLATGMPQSGFSLCLPVLNDQLTIGVILIGPMGRSLPHAKEVGRTIALITSVSMTSAAVLKRQHMLAETDGLTGLLNKTSIRRRVEQLISAEDGGPPVVSIFLFDVDRFKVFNDTNGHLQGDLLLQTLSRLLSENVRDGDLAGRWGGEEFLIVMPASDRAEALRAADRIRMLIEDHAFANGESQPGGRVTVSGGVATWPTDGGEVEILFERAGQALYAAKRAGRNLVFAPSEADPVVQPDSDVLDLEVLVKDP